MGVADLYVSMGVECLQHGSDARSNELALLLLEEAFGIYQAKAGDSHERTIGGRIHLGKAHQALLQYDSALDCFCMAGYRSAYGDKHPKVISVLQTIAGIHVDMGNHDK